MIKDIRNLALAKLDTDCLRFAVGFHHKIDGRIDNHVPLKYLLKSPLIDDYLKKNVKKFKKYIPKMNFKGIQVFYVPAGGMRKADVEYVVLK